MIDGESALSPECLDMPIAQCITQIPADGAEAHLAGKVLPLERGKKSSWEVSDDQGGLLPFLYQITRSCCYRAAGRERESNDGNTMLALDIYQCRESIMATQLTDIVESSQAERLASGFVFTEGPLWHPEGYWLFVDVRASLIYRLAPGGRPEIFREQAEWWL